MDMNNNNKSTPSLWAQEAQQVQSRTWKGVYPNFQGFFVLFAALLCFPSWFHKDSRTRCHLELCGEVGAEIGA